jgi:glycosyltransferase involved in cell wall biosynthesis
MTTPLVSVLMTAYNREKYIAEAIESVLAQTFRDFELIVVDDQSSDLTVEVARHYARDPRVKVHVNERNLGDYPNRNRAASLARGRYLKYLDADDLMYSHCLSVMTRQMERFPDAGIGLEGEEESNWPRPFPFVLSPAEAYQDYFFGRGVIGQGPTASIVRAEIFREFDGFLPERHISDTELWLRVTRKYPLMISCSGLTWWRQHSEQEHERGVWRGPVIARRYQLAVSALMAENCPLGADQRRAALRRIKGECSRRIAGAVARGRLSVALSLGRVMWKIVK